MSPPFRKPPPLLAARYEALVAEGRIVRDEAQCEALGALDRLLGELERALADARRAGHRLVVLVGDEPYYARAGFKRIPKRCVTMPGPVDPKRLLYFELREGALAATSGRMRRQ